MIQAEFPLPDLVTGLKPTQLGFILRIMGFVFIGTAGQRLAVGPLPVRAAGFATFVLHGAGLFALSSLVNSANHQNRLLERQSKVLEAAHQQAANQVAALERNGDLLEPLVEECRGMGKAGVPAVGAASAGQ